MAMSVVVSPRRERFLSLDVFRGLTIALMILVNTPGAGVEPYAQLRHAKWFGLTLADLVFPSFLFAVGSAMSFALPVHLSAGAYLGKVGKRAALIFACGFLMYWYPFFQQQTDGSWAFKALAETRVMGVLQRIALCYLLAALLLRWLSYQAVSWVAAVMLLGYWLLLYLFGLPGQELDKLGNAGTRLDLWLLGREHLYRKDGGFDPEGLLGTLPATVNVLCGYLAGVFLQHNGKDTAAVRRLLWLGSVALVLAWLGNPYWPISKKLWTGPFVLCTVAVDLLLLALLLWWLEVRGHRWGSGFFTVLGRNPLAIYLFSVLLVVSVQKIQTSAGGAYDWIGIRIFQPLAPGALGSLLCALAYTLLCWGVGWWMDRQRIYLRL
jgi:predicted acyltransferase